MLFGNPPTPDDLLFPTISPRRRNKELVSCSHGEIAWWWREHDLPAAGLRHRRMHDSRRTFIGMLRSAGARDEVLRKITHWSTEDEVLDAYTTWEWDAFWREVRRAPAAERSGYSAVMIGGKDAVTRRLWQRLRAFEHEVTLAKL